MSRSYEIPMPAVSITAVQDLWDIVPATNLPIKILGIILSQITRHGDAQEEMLGWSIHRGLATVGSGGTSATIARVDQSDAAASLTARLNDTTQAVVGGGSDVVLWRDQFNVRQGIYILKPPKMQWVCGAGETRLVISLDTAPSVSMSFRGTVTVQEGLDT